MIQLKVERDKWINYRQQMESQVAQLKGQLAAVHRQQHPLPPSSSFAPTGSYFGGVPPQPHADVTRSQQASQSPSSEQQQETPKGRGVPLEESFRWVRKKERKSTDIKVIFSFVSSRRSTTPNS